MGSFSGLGIALKNLRLRRDLNQLDLSRKCGLSRGTLSGYESGRENATAQSLGAILDALGFTVLDLGAELAAVQASGEPVPPPEASGPDEIEQLGAELGGAILRILRDAGVSTLGPSGKLQKNVATAIDRVVGPPRQSPAKGRTRSKGKR